MVSRDGKLTVNNIYFTDMHSLGCVNHILINKYYFKCNLSE